SIGVQTFDDDCLQRIGRIHNADEARNALHIARDSGFTRLNIDLMYGLPGQQPHQALADAREAVSFDPGHISQYQLTLEPGTVFAKSPPSLPDDDITWAMLTSCQAVLSAGGYRRYEVSALARDGQQCRHNLNYWLFGDYIGVGAGAHGKLTLGQRICRTERPRPPTIYMSRSPRDWTDRVVDEGSLPFEFMLNALRLPDGFDPALFVARTGLPATTIAGIIEQACAREMLSIDTDCWRASEQGLRFLNDLQAMFLPATSA
ncbi:MAG: oxygen-independent coproporphyrinogen III oxidase-like protein, partial [Gammaproteobacteria bacterium]|nr:oxygen-independent coproporphyrinogen III oxidase-like protein [Gammaproteobacteria bacterium]